MNMGLGFSEVLLILVLVLMFFGSKEIPHLIRVSARFMARIRQYSEKVKQELEDIRRSVEEVPDSLQDTVGTRKQEIRKKYLALRKSLTPESRKRLSEMICKHFKCIPQFGSFTSIMLYHSMGSEVETHLFLDELLAAGVRVVLPYCKDDGVTLGIGEIRNPKDDLAIGTHGAFEPKPELRDNFFRSDLGAVVCPGVAFDTSGCRMGRGKACYDNFLRELKGKVPIIGLAFQCQISENSLPFAYHDVVMDQIITENGFQLSLDSSIQTPPLSLQAGIAIRDIL